LCTYHFPLFAREHDGAVVLLHPVGVAGGQVVQAAVDMLAHGHDVIEVLLGRHGELEASLGGGVGVLGGGQAVLDLHGGRTAGGRGGKQNGGMSGKRGHVHVVLRLVFHLFLLVLYLEIVFGLYFAFLIGLHFVFLFVLYLYCIL